MQDSFDSFIDSPMAPSTNCFDIAPSDSGEIPQATKAIYVGIGGSVTLRSLRGNSDVTFYNVPSGAILDVRVRLVKQTGTTASGIIGLA